jgi:hypothetical protein
MPWTPLSLAAPIGPFTTRKIDGLAEDTAFCQKLLNDAGIEFSQLPPVKAGSDCGYDNGIALINSDNQGNGINYRPVVKISCPMAVSLILLEKQIINAAAIQHFDNKVAEIVTYGSYSCRRVNNAPTGNFSEHATANALDIAAFRLTDGRIISVEKHWNTNDKRSAFLKEVRDGACRIFATTLSPDYNAAHSDHLHLDQARRGGGNFWR